MRNEKGNIMLLACCECVQETQMDLPTIISSALIGVLIGLILSAIFD